jgi:hypothetical protein
MARGLREASHISGREVLLGRYVALQRYVRELAL